MDRYERLQHAAEQISAVLAIMEAEGVPPESLAYHLLVNAKTIVLGTASLMERDAKT